MHSPPQDSPWTVEKLLQWTTDYFRQGGIDTARLDAEVLLAHALKKRRLDLYNEYLLRVGETERAAFRELVRRRRQAEPVAYITGVREFYSIPLEVDPSVLIPRPETEHLVEYALRFANTAGLAAIGPGAPRVLDVGTGSGNISLALARHMPEARIVSLDVSASALAVAARNRTAQPEDVAGRVSLVQGSLLDCLHPERARFHLIVSNPPYVADAAWQDLPPDVREYEPRRALVAGPRGTEVQELLLRDVWRYLAEHGTLVMEMGYDQSQSLRDAAEAQGSYRDIEVLRDYAGQPRVLVAKRGKL